MNFDPSIRYTDEYMFQIAMLHSNNNPDLDSFLRPIADELNKLSTNGMVVMKNGEEISRACVVPLMVTGDIPAVAKIIHHPGHNSFYGCRFCYTCGEHAENGYGISVDWPGLLLYIVPTLVVPILVDKSAQSALLALVRACAVTLQWSVTETETCRIEASMGPLRAYSCCLMKRMIGKYKRLAHSRIAAGENIGNIMELPALFAFLKDTGMVSLEPLESKPLYKDNTFNYHPSDVKEVPKLWDLTKVAIDVNDKSGVILGVPITKVEAALRSYLRRLNMVGTSMQQTIISPAKRLWRDSQVISSALYTFSKKGIQRSSGFVMPESNHLKKMPIPFRVLLWSTDSFYVFVELMKEHGAASHDPNISTVVPFSPNQAKAYAVFDAADILSVVGLVSSFKKVGRQSEKMVVQESRYLQVIRPSIPLTKT
ncbi:hypothetical protein G6F56_008876 [Rhizopus delemar]|nr:hypothetical protein G6F56_008876 [Rhizopus delemar]